jgi:hypothetical protein
MAKKSKPKRTNKLKQSASKSGLIFEGLVGMAQSLANSKKDWGVEKINEFANATKGYASSLKDIPNVGSYVRAAADFLNDFAEYVSETEFEQILTDSSTFVKRHPIITASGCAVAGLMITYLLRSNDGILRTKRSARKARPSASARKRRSASAGIRIRKVNGQGHVNA